MPASGDVPDRADLRTTRRRPWSSRSLACMERGCHETGLPQERFRQEMEAWAQRSDLIVMGARCKDALSAAMLGSTTAEVVRETQIPTLVVKPKGAGRSFLELLLGNP